MAFSWNRDRWSNERPLLRWSRQGAHHYVADAVTHTSVMGTTGSGKTTGLGYILAAAYLRADMGFVICTAKPEDIPMWLRYATEHGRFNSVCVFDEAQGINFINYLLGRFGAKGIASIIECLMRVLAAADAATGNHGTPTEPFWEHAVRQLLNYALPLIFAAHGTVSVATLIRFIVTAATDGKQYTDKAWVAASFAGQTLRKAVDNPAVAMPREELEALLVYWIQQFPEITERTRSNIVASVTTKLDLFLHGRMKGMFCGKTTIVPELAFHGGIILLAFPVLTWGIEGVVAQLLFKYLFQVAVEGRNGLSPEHRERPVCLWMDEAHYFLAVEDDAFLSTCRASRCCVVALSQSLPSYYARLGKQNTDAVDGLLGKFNTHIFCLNGCPRTNQWASQLIGRGLQERANRGRSTGTNRSKGMSQGTNTNRNTGSSSNHGSQWSGQGGGGNHSAGSSSSAGSGENWGANVGTGTNESTNWGCTEQMDNLIEPGFFANGLKNGGPANNYQVTAVLLRVGANFPDGFVSPSTLLVTFRQRRR